MSWQWLQPHCRRRRKKNDTSVRLVTVKKSKKLLCLLTEPREHARVPTPPPPPPRALHTLQESMWDGTRERMCRRQNGLVCRIQRKRRGLLFVMQRRVPTVYGGRPHSY